MTMTISRPELDTNIDVSAYAPVPPLYHHEPLKVADDTYLIRTLTGEGTAPVGFYVNSALILGQEPVIIDTGLVSTREAWMNDVFSLVDPKDVRWIFISHDDHDHVGNLPQVLAMCPNATLISTWFQVERLSGDLGLPLHRMRWVDAGQSFDAGDRTFVTVRPPVFDSPTTRGLYDSRTGVYWASDAFATPVAVAMDDVSGMHPEEWRQGFAMTNLAVSPWIEMVDAVKYNKSVDAIARLDVNAIISAHSPAILGDYVNSAIDLMYDLPSQPMPQLPGQETLDGILAQIAAQQPAV